MDGLRCKNYSPLTVGTSIRLMLATVTLALRPEVFFPHLDHAADDHKEAAVRGGEDGLRRDPVALVR